MQYIRYPLPVTRNRTCSSTHIPLYFSLFNATLNMMTTTGSRKWYDFDVRPSGAAETSLRTGRRLDQPDVFEVVEGLKKTMIDELECLQMD